MAPSSCDSSGGGGGGVAPSCCDSSEVCEASGTNTAASALRRQGSMTPPRDAAPLSSMTMTGEGVSSASLFGASTAIACCRIASFSHDSTKRYVDVNEYY